MLGGLGEAGEGLGEFEGSGYSQDLAVGEVGAHDL